MYDGIASDPIEVLQGSKCVVSAGPLCSDSVAVMAVRVTFSVAAVLAGASTESHDVDRVASRRVGG